jgi:phospholipid/cholesterol/gamma-HCH transport system substrate-binding protein
MKHFRERNLRVLGLVTVVLVVGLVYGALQFPNLPLVNSRATYSAYLSDAANLVPTDQVWVYGVSVGSVTQMVLDGAAVKVTFTVGSEVHLGSTTSAAVAVQSPIGTEVLKLNPSGPGNLAGGTIPLSRTSVPFTLVDALSGFSEDVQGYNKAALEKSFNVISQNLSATSGAKTQAAFKGLARLSQIFGEQSGAIASVISQGAGITSVLSQRSGQLFDLVGQADIVLKVLEQRRAVIKSLLDGTAALSQKLSQFLSSNSPQLTTLFDNLKSVTAVLAENAGNVGRSIPLLAALAKYTANSTGSGPFVDAAVPTLLIPDNVFEQCSGRNAFPSANPQVGCHP